MGKEAGDEGVDLCRQNRGPKQSGRYPCRPQRYDDCGCRDRWLRVRGVDGYAGVVEVRIIRRVEGGKVED